MKPNLLAAVGLAAALNAGAAELPQPKFRAVNVDTNIAIGYGLAVADIDGDQRPDIVLCDKNQIAWYRNPGWEKSVVAEKLTELDHVCVAAADVDGDGKAEIAVGAGWNPGDTQNSGALFFLKPPADRTQRWTPVKLAHEPTMHRIRWVKDWQGRMTLISAPLHGRGNDAGKGTGAGVKLQRYRPPEKLEGEWEVETLNDQLHKTHNFDFVQWDDDATPEIAVAAKEGVFVLNWSREQGGYVSEQIGSDENGGCGEVRGGSLGGGRKFLCAVSPMHGNQLALFTPAPNGAKPWTRAVLDDSLIDGHALACGDLLGIGRDQIVVGWRAMGRPRSVKVGLKLLTPMDAEGKEWRTTLLDDDTMACEDLQLADFNGDGKLDIVAAGRGTRNVKVWLNER
jgi:hypothetical protein